MVTKTSWDAVVRMLLAAMHSFFEKFRGDIAAFLAFHENESRRQLIEMNESLDQVRKAMIAMTTLFADKMDAFLAEAKAACAGRASNDYDSALMNKTLEVEAEVKRLANLLTSRVHTAACSPEKKVTIAIDELPDIKMTFSPRELAEWLNEIHTPLSPVLCAGLIAGSPSEGRTLDEAFHEATHSSLPPDSADRTLDEADVSSSTGVPSSTKRSAASSSNDGDEAADAALPESPNKCPRT